MRAGWDGTLEFGFPIRCTLGYCCSRVWLLSLASSGACSICCLMTLSRARGRSTGLMAERKIRLTLIEMMGQRNTQAKRDITLYCRCLKFYLKENLFYLQPIKPNTHIAPLILNSDGLTSEVWFVSCPVTVMLC